MADAGHRAPTDQAQDTENQRDGETLQLPIADVLKTHRFSSSEDPEQTLLTYVTLYNRQLPLSALKSKAPIQAIKDWYQQHINLFYKRP